MASPGHLAERAVFDRVARAQSSVTASLPPSLKQEQSVIPKGADVSLGSLGFIPRLPPAKGLRPASLCGGAADSSAAFVRSTLQEVIEMVIRGAVIVLAPELQFV